MPLHMQITGDSRRRPATIKTFTLSMFRHTLDIINLTTSVTNISKNFGNDEERSPALDVSWLVTLLLLII